MKRAFVTLSLIFCMSIVAFSQNVVKLGDDLLTANSMEKSPKILSDGGMIIEPIEDMLGIDPNLRITASNGVEPQVPIMCTVEAMSKADKRISIITFIYNGNAEKLETNLRNLGYKFLDNGQYREYIRFVIVGIRRAKNIAAYHILQMVIKEQNLNLYCNSKVNIRGKVGKKYDNLTKARKRLISFGNIENGSVLTDCSHF